MISKLIIYFKARKQFDKVVDDVYTNADVKKAIKGNNPFLWIKIWFYVGLKFGFMSDILWFYVRYIDFQVSFD